MSISREQRNRKRKYAKEYADYHGKPEQIKRRAGRNQARRKMEKAGKVRKGDNKDVSHDNHDTTDNRSSNLTVKKRSNNRSKHGRKY